MSGLGLGVVQFELGVDGQESGGGRKAQQRMRERDLERGFGYDYSVGTNLSNDTAASGRRRSGAHGRNGSTHGWGNAHVQPVPGLRQRISRYFTLVLRNVRRLFSASNSSANAGRKSMAWVAYVQPMVFVVSVFAVGVCGLVSGGKVCPLSFLFHCFFSLPFLSFPF